VTRTEVGMTFDAWPPRDDVQDYPIVMKDDLSSRVH
jgi:hypothetical protein